jgi:hypothetical protein
VATLRDAANQLTAHAGSNRVVEIPCIHETTGYIERQLATEAV